MKKNKFLVISVLIALCAALVILPVSAATNLCRTATILGADTGVAGETYTFPDAHFCQFVADAENPNFLIDDDDGYATKWCATDAGNHPDEPHWVIIDFGEEKTFDSLKLVKASEGERDFGGVAMDASAYTFSASSDLNTWTEFCKETENHDPIYTKTFEPVTARYVKLTLEGPEEDPTNMTPAARLYDLAIYEAAAATAPVEETTAAPVEETTAAPAEIAPVEETTAAPVEQAPVETTAAPAPVSTPTVPATGDATVVYIILAVASVAAIGITLKVKKNRA